MSAQSFACPNCKAPIEYSSGMGKTVTCRFCGTSVVVPQELRTGEHKAVPRQMVQPQMPQPIVIDATPITQGAGGSMISGCIGLIITGVVIVVVIGIIIMASGGALVAALLPVAGTTSSGTTTGSSPDIGIPSIGDLVTAVSATSMPTDVPFAAVALQFGQEGTGAGFFQDARHIAVDGAGNIYVGEYSGGRIQAFDPSGNFITQWIPGPDIYMTGLAASRDGIVYAVYGGKIYKYQGLTGTLLGQVEYPAGTYFSTIDIAADGGLVLTMSSAGEDDVFFFDSQGNFKSKIENPVTEAPGAPFDASADQISTDGLGNLFAVTSGSEPSVYKFNAQGQFVGRFTGPTEDVNGVEFVSPADVAVDSQSRIFISDPFSGIIILDSNGNYIRTIDVDTSGSLSGMVFDYAGNLWVVARTEVVKLTINK